jgi:hypothetical protein
MKKRNLVAFLWFFGGWTLGSALAFFAGLPWVLGPTLAVFLAAVVWWDPAGLLWPTAGHVQRVSGNGSTARRTETDPAPI